jgi:hypothetical protein
VEAVATLIAPPGDTLIFEPTDTTPVVLTVATFTVRVRFDAVPPTTNGALAARVMTPVFEIVEVDPGGVPPVTTLIPGPPMIPATPPVALKTPVIWSKVRPEPTVKGLYSP